MQSFELAQTNFRIPSIIKNRFLMMGSFQITLLMLWLCCGNNIFIQKNSLMFFINPTIVKLNPLSWYLKFSTENSNVTQLSLAKWTATIVFASYLILSPWRRMFFCHLCFIRLPDSSDGEIEKVVG